MTDVGYKSYRGESKGFDILIISFNLTVFKI